MPNKLSRSEQARINGAKSKGPKTDQGRAKCAQANLTHGAYAARISTLPHEDQASYAATWDAAFDQFKPRNILEIQLLSQYVDWTWRAGRFLSAANTESLNRAAGYVQSSQGEVSWAQAHVQSVTEHATVQSLHKEAARCTFNAARVLRQLNDLRKLGVSAEASQQCAEIMDEIVTEGEMNNPASPWELPECHLTMPNPPAQHPTTPQRC